MFSEFYSLLTSTSWSNEGFGCQSYRNDAIKTQEFSDMSYVFVQPDKNLQRTSYHVPMGHDTNQELLAKYFCKKVNIPRYIN